MLLYSFWSFFQEKRVWGFIKYRVVIVPRSHEVIVLSNCTNVAFSICKKVKEKRTPHSVKQLDLTPTHSKLAAPHLPSPSSGGRMLANTSSLRRDTSCLWESISCLQLMQWH